MEVMKEKVRGTSPTLLLGNHLLVTLSGYNFQSIKVKKPLAREAEKETIPRGHLLGRQRQRKHGPVSGLGGKSRCGKVWR